MKKFFKKIGYSIGRIEKYSEMATDGTKSAIKYIAGVLVLITLIASLGSVYTTYQSLQEVANYIEENIPEFTYKDGKLTVEGEQPLIKDNLIMDVNDKTDEEITEYKNKIREKGNGVLVLKDEMMLVYAQSEDVSIYPLSEFAAQFQMQEIKKSDVLNYMRGSQMFGVYVGMFVTMFLTLLISNIANALCIALVLAAVGYVVALLLKVKMRYKAIFNMAIYALTLSVILQTIYVAINIFTTFSITYFDIMYIAVAFIYLVAAIFLTRIDLIKTQEELTKVKEVQKEVKEEMKEQEEEKEKEKEKQNKDNKKEDKNVKKEPNKKKKNKKQRKEENGGEPEGSNV